MISKRFCKKQQMQWTKRAAHLLLQTRVKTLNNELASVLRGWYPDFSVEEDEPGLYDIFCVCSHRDWT